MNRELMEKIAKRKEDPNYPYGNKLGKGRSVREAADTAIGLPTLGALVGGALGLPLGGGGALAGATLGGIATAVMTPGAVKNQYAQSEERRTMSYLPSGEQIKLRKELDRLDDMKYKISDKMERMEDRNIGLIDDIESVPKDIAQKYNSLSVKLSDIGVQKHNLSANALARGKALMLAEKKNRRLFKKASDYLDEAVMEKEARAKIEYVAMGKNSDGKDCMRTVRLTRAEAKKFMKNRKLPAGNLAINRRNKKVYLVDDTGKRTKKHIGVIISEKMI
jgi:hypothetical protein